MHNWNLEANIEQELQEIIKGEACIFEEKNGSLCLNDLIDPFKFFDTPEWIKEAMRRAYCLGRLAGEQEAKENMQKAIGLIVSK